MELKATDVVVRLSRKDIVKQASDFNIAIGRVVVTLDELTALVALFEC